MFPQAPVFLVIIVGLSALLSAFLAAWAWFHKRVPGAQEFFWLYFFVAIYSLGYSIEISRPILQDVLIAVKFEYIGMAFSSPMLLLFALRFVRQKPLAWGYTVALLVIPVITLFLVFTVENHNWFYIQPHMSVSGLYPVIVFGRGIWYHVNSIFISLVQVAGLVVLVVFAFRTRGRQKMQAIVIAVGCSLPIVSTILYLLELIPFNIEPVAISAVISGLFFAVALFRLGVFEIVPAARELALDSIRDGFLVVDQNNILLDFNAAALQLPGLQGLVRGKDILDNIVLGSLLRPLLSCQNTQVEFSLVHLNNSIHFYQANAHHLQSSTFYNRGVAILIRDVTETVNLMDKLSQQANIDELTGLLNRRCLMSLGLREWELSRQSNRPLGIILIDLDFFKAVNDRYGHAAGDKVLIHTANCLSKSLRSQDIIGRYGGEEFTIFLPGTPLEAVLQIAERLRQLLEDTGILVDGNYIHITGSFGASASVPLEGQVLDDILKKADEALYLSKSRGRNRVSSST